MNENNLETVTSLSSDLSNQETITIQLEELLVAGNYDESDEIAVMDSTAIALCKDNNIPIMVFDIFKKGNISKAVAGEPIGSLIS